MRQLHRGKGSGVLIAESVVAAFLMLFAFVASAALFDAALRWESSGTNLRRAAMIADKRMEELRQWVATGGSATSFPSDAEWDTEAARITSYPEAPGFIIEVSHHLAEYDELLNTSITPPAGFHSPCSRLYTPPPGAGSPVNESQLDNFLDNHPQYNHQYDSRPYSRDMSGSYKLVEIVVSYGGGTEPQQYRMLSVIGDPLLTDPMSITISSVGGNEYRAEASVSGKVVPDMVIDWGSPIVPGNNNEIGAYTNPVTATGTNVRVQAMPGNSGIFMLGARARYRGQARVGTLELNL